MQKVILITGATDGIGLETAKMLASQGHHLLIHGRNPTKLAQVEQQLATLVTSGSVESYVADLSHLADVEALAVAVAAKHSHIDVLINNAGVYIVPQIISKDDLDIRFMVNTIAPYLLTKRLLGLMDTSGRVVNLSSAAQASVNPKALATANTNASDSAIYAQSKLAITMWSAFMAAQLKENGPAIIAVNPASLLGSKMVKEAYGMAGGDLTIGADILCRAALSDEFSEASGRYFDNDSGRFASPHSDATNPAKNQQLVDAIESVLAAKLA